MTTTPSSDAPVPDSNTVLAELQPLVPTMYRVMDAALQQACIYFQAEGRDVNRPLHPALVRYRAKLGFEEAGQEVTDELDEGEWEAEQLANNGLSLVYRGYRIRILKALANQHVPPPGVSRRKRAFYRQEGTASRAQISLPELESDEDDEVRLNLLIVWMLDSGYRLNELVLVCPADGEDTVDSVRVWWKCTIPNPIQGLGPAGPSHGPIGPPDEDGEMPYRLPGGEVDLPRREEFDADAGG